MRPLGKLSIARHAAVGAATLGVSALAFTGLIGQPTEERFEAKQVVVFPSGDDGLRIREVVDIDFGRNDRRGYERIVPNDFGAPVDVEAESADAPDDVATAPDVYEGQSATRIRVGDPDQTVSGQHRYVLTYTLPDARLDSGMLALDVIGTEETFETEVFDVVVTGLELTDPLCNVGGRGSSGGCTLERDGDAYRATIEGLEPGEGITIGGTIVGRSTPAEVPIPPLPDRRADNSTTLALAMLPLGAAAGAGAYAWSRRRGRNEVYAGGAADAAYGNGPVLRPTPGAPLPAPTLAPPSTGLRSPMSVRMIADQQMDELATIEFVPPQGVEPWLGAAVLGEQVDNSTVAAWFSGLAARDVLTIEKDPGDPGKVLLGRGGHPERAHPADRALVDELFAGGPTIELGRYDREFSSVWSKVRARQQDHIRQAGLWKRLPPSASGCSGQALLPIMIVAAVWLFIGAGGVLAAFAGLAASPIAALALGVVVPFVVALAAYRTLLPVRSAEGSAIALRTESFRRFLAASEGQHVEWAWKHGILREYSAWAVALGTADAWERALETSQVPPADYVSGPLLVYSMGPAFGSTHTAPSSSGSGGSFGGGGFSGGSVGGGGGGGSSGSW